jgi:hypothetical protein
VEGFALPAGGGADPLDYSRAWSIGHATLLYGCNDTLADATGRRLWDWEVAGGATGFRVFDDLPGAGPSKL